MQFFIRLLLLLVAISLASAAAQDQEGSVWTNRKSAWLLLTPAQKQELQQFSEDYKNYLRQARSALTSTRQVLSMAKSAGFTEFTAAGQVKPGARLIIPDRGRALILAVIGSEGLVNGSR